MKAFNWVNDNRFSNGLVLYNTESDIVERIDIRRADYGTVTVQHGVMYRVMYISKNDNLSSIISLAEKFINRIKTEQNGKEQQ